MFEDIKKWIKNRKAKETTKPTTVNKKAPETEMIMPFAGSALGSSKKEAMAGLLYEAMRSNNKQQGERILVSELMETIQELGKNERLPTTYKLFSKPCWNAFWEMVEEGLLIVHQKDEENESFVTVTEKLDKLLSPAISQREKLSVS